ncbi:MAG: hypothetical protein J6U86_04810 [Clostridia bacterium]|nr:hypothetical protein [Clostridia bacterium]
MIKKQSTLIKRKRAAVIISVITVLLLAIALVLVLDFVNATSVEDPADGTIYYIRKKNDVYSLYDTDKKTVMPTDEEYGYYVTHANTLISVDAKTGEYEIIATVDTEGNEQVGFNQRVLMFPHIEKANILSLEVHNPDGDYTFSRYNLEKEKLDPSANFIIEGSPLTSINEEEFSSLYVGAGYTITTRKIQDPIKDANGEFSEYGLIPCKRVREVMDEDGEFVLDKNDNYIYEEYDYVPAYYVLTDIDGNKYKVILGDMMVTGGGYYAQYVDISGETEVKRDAVYVLSADTGDCILSSVERYAMAQLTYPMNMNNYFNVENFYIINKSENSLTDYDDPVVGFSYVDMSLRENTINANLPYEFLEGFELNGYTPYSDRIDTCLQSLYSPSITKIAKLSPDVEDFVKYGLMKDTSENNSDTPKYEMLPKHIIVFNYKVLDDNGKHTETLQHRIYVSDITEDNTYYAFTEIYVVDSNGKASSSASYDYNMIVEVEDHTFEFLNWDRFDWINSGIVNLNISFCEKITITTPNYSNTFVLNNTVLNSTDSTSSTTLKVHATDSSGNSKTTFSHMNVEDESGNIWTITGTEIVCYSSAGKQLTIKTAHYDYNVMGTQVRVISGAIPCKDGSRIYVDANEVRVVTGAGTTTYVRYDTNLFRRFYQTLLYASISDSYEVTSEQEASITTNENLLMVMEITTSEGETKTYKFYKLTSRKAYITINGNGGFYVLTDRIEKIVSDAQKFMNNELIDATAKK